MCKDCGCEQGNAKAFFHHQHTHSHQGDSGEVHVHVHADIEAVVSGKGIHVHIYLNPDSGYLNPDSGHRHHDHQHHDHDYHDHDRHYDIEGQPRKAILESRVLARNDKFAEKNRAFLKELGCVAVNFISSPGSGKTFLLEKTLEGLHGRVKCAVIAGDQQTDNDAVRLRNKGAAVLQIETGSSCHLNAEQVGQAMEQVLEEGVKLLFIENVGNLVCPASFDLGENVKIALLSVTEGEDKPLKYPLIFHDAPASVITKKDLLNSLSVDMEKYRESLSSIHPGGKVFELSALTGDGMEEWLSYLEGLTSIRS
ncbi:MAG: hydrogenase accessory protein HypB [Planctomycetota bacterium]|nr:MAG: hydrogenase accessory protein HypB [Planctomycetota bacterium]